MTSPLASRASQSAGKNTALAHYGIPLVALLAGFIFISLPETSYFSGIPGNIGDARFNNVILEHLYRWCVGLDPMLWSPGFFYPVRGALSFSDNHFGSGVVYVMARGAGLSEYQAFNTWFLVGTVTNFIACYFVLRRFRFSSAAAALAALVFAFALPVTAQDGHAQLSYRWAVPLAILAWAYFVDRKSIKALAACALLVCAEFYNSIYLGYFLTLVLIGYLAAQFVIARYYRATAMPHVALFESFRAATRKDLVIFALSLFVAVVLMYVLMHPYLAYAKAYHFSRDPSEIAMMLPRFGSYFIADYATYWGKVSQQIINIPMRQEHQIFIGMVPLILVIAGVLTLKTRPSAWVASSALALALVVLATISVHDHSLYMLFAKLPGMNAIRAVTRIILVLLFPLAVLIAASVDSLLKRDTSKPALYLGIVVAAALVIFEASSYKRDVMLVADAEARISTITATLPLKLASNAILYVPVQASGGFADELDGMVVSQRLNRPTLNGYSGNSPAGYYAGNDADTCGQIASRVSSAMSIAPKDVVSIPDFASRIVIARGATCTAVERTQPDPLLTREAMAQVAMQALAPEVVGENALSLSVTVDNKSNFPLKPNSNRMAPVHMSWQFYGSDSAPTPDNWRDRGDIRLVPAGQSITMHVAIATTLQPGRYRLVVSLVQEGIGWFHDAGMPLAKVDGIFVVDKSGRLSIEPSR